MERFDVGDSVVISKENMQAIIDSNKSIKFYPSDSYVTHIYKFFKSNAVGMITFTFPPGHNYAVDFDGATFHMKCNWITRVVAVGGAE